MFLRLIKYLCFVFALSVCIMFQTSCTNSIATPKCTITLAQSQEIRGFRLGMTLDELKQKFPNLPEPKYEPRYKSDSIFGLPELEFYSVSSHENSSGTTTVFVDKNQYPDFKGIHNIIVQFLDNKICSIKVTYKTETKDPKIKEEFYQKIYELLKLDGGWTQPNSEEADKKLMTCSGFTVLVNMNKDLSGNYLPYVILTNPEGEASIRAMEENNKMKLKQTDEKKITEFKP